MNTKNLLVIASLGILSLGAAGCNGDDAAAGPSTPAASPSPKTTPSAKPVARPKVSDSTVVLIGPDGKKYTRHAMVKKSVRMALLYGKKNLPSDFCEKSYQEGIKGGGKFPAGEDAYVDACQEGVDLGD